MWTVKTMDYCTGKVSGWKVGVIRRGKWREKGLGYFIWVRVFYISILNMA